MKRHRKTLLFLLTSAIILIFFFVGIGAATAEITLRVGSNLNVTGRDPHIGLSLQDVTVWSHVLEPLVTLDLEKGAAIKPALAESWKQTNPLTWRFYLKKGVKFHNGERFTASAVKATYERIANPDKPLGWSFFLPTGLFSKAVVVDDYTVDIVLKKVNNALLYSLAYIGILPPSVTSEYFTDNGPIGTGPFQFVSWDGIDVVLKKNENYWGAKPKVDKIIFKYIPESAARSSALRAGSVDIIDRVSPDDVDVLKNEGFAVSSIETVESVFIRLNSHKKPFDDVRVRQALNYAVDRKAIAELLLKGYARPATSVIGKYVFGYADMTAIPGNPKYEYNPTKAKELLKQAGYAKGFDVTLMGPSGVYMKVPEILQTVAGQLSQVGVRAKLDLREIGAWQDTLYGSENWEMVFAGIVALTGNADFPLRFQFHPDFKPMGTLTPEKTNNLIDQGIMLAKPEEQLQAYKEVQKILWTEPQRIFLHEEYSISALRPGIKGFKSLRDFTTTLTDVEVTE
jgi:ABC-type transport system substrate-binding protein